MENFTALYVYADGVTVTIGFPPSGATVYELVKTTAGAQTWVTQPFSGLRRGEVEMTFDQGVYGWRVESGTTITVSEHPDVAVQTRTKPAKDPWPAPPPPPPPTKFAHVNSTQWNLHFKNGSLREDEFMYTLGGAAALPAPETIAQPAPGALSMTGVHVAATRRGPAYGATAAAGELTFPTDMLAIAHRLTHVRGAAQSQFLVGERATRAELGAAVRAAARRIAPGGVFVLSFAGHGAQLAQAGEPDGTGEAWQLYDGFLRDDELGDLLAAFDASVHCAIIADCCYGGGMADVTPAAARADLQRRARGASTALIAATGARQAKVNTPGTPFGRTLEQLLSSGRAPSYRALAAALRDETPSCERAQVWCSDERTWDLPPLGR